MIQPGADIFKDEQEGGGGGHSCVLYFESGLLEPPTFGISGSGQIPAPAPTPTPTSIPLLEKYNQS